MKKPVDGMRVDSMQLEERDRIIHFIIVVQHLEADKVYPVEAVKFCNIAAEECLKVKTDQQLKREVFL